MALEPSSTRACTRASSPADRRPSFRSATPIPFRKRPRCGSVLAVLSPTRAFRLSADHPDRLAPLARPGVCQAELLEPTTPDDFCSCHDSRTQPRAPILVVRAAYVLADYDRRRSSATPRTAGARPSVSRPRARSVAAPLIRRSLEHPSSFPRACEDRERSSSPLGVTEASSSTRSRERNAWSSRPDAFPHQPPATVYRARARTREPVPSFEQPVSGQRLCHRPGCQP